MSTDEHGYNRRGKRSPTYSTWRAMINRCSLPSVYAYRWYGARGIRVCERWLSFANFLSDMGERPEGCTLDRQSNDGNYELSNCKWSTRRDQSRHRGNVKLTVELAAEVRGRCERGESRRAVAELMGVTKAAIEKVVDGTNWRTL